MQIITCHFNPCGYRNLIQNYWRFRDSLGTFADRLVTVELSFTGEFEIPDAIQIMGDPNRNWMWQKERLINVAIERTNPRRYAWVDADLLFDGTDWIHEADRLLDLFPMAQLFSQITFLGRDGLPGERRPSTVSHKQRGTGTAATSPGGAWAANREWLPKVPFDDNIVGGGDDMLVRAIYGDWWIVLKRPMCEAWRHAYLAEAAKIHRMIGPGGVGVLDRHVTHLWHGDRSGRRYLERHQILTDAEFDPATDIRIGDNGVWEWASHKPALHGGLRDYFRGRDEDGDANRAAVAAGRMGSADAGRAGIL
jgi:hypothetical protein